MVFTLEQEIPRVLVQSDRSQSRQKSAAPSVRHALFLTSFLNWTVHKDLFRRKRRAGSSHP